MPFSYVQYPGNGSTVTFSVPFPYLLRAHVKLYYGLSLQSGGYTQLLVDGVNYSWTSATQVQLTAAPVVGQTLSIRRETPTTSRLVDWNDGSALTADALDTADLQNFYAIQEHKDYIEALSINPNANVTDGSITANKLSSDAVTTIKIQDQAVTTDKIADQAVTTGKIADGAILNADVNATAGIAATKLAFTQAGTGAAVRTIDSKLKEVVSVKDFGAVGNGVADDTDAITNALAALLGRGGGTLYFPTGIYLISAGIPLVGKVHYKGEGREASIIRQTSWDAVIGMGYRTGIAEDPGLTGTGLNSDATIPAKLKQSATTRLGGIVPTLNYWKISDLTLDGGASPSKQIHKDDAFGNVIRLELHAYGEICSCNIINSWNQGVSVYFYSSDITIHDCTFKNIGQPGGTPIGYLGSRFYSGNAIFVEYSGDRTIITGNLFESIDQRCVWYTCGGEAGDNKQKDHVFADNICFYNGAQAAAVEAIYGGTYTNGIERIAGIHGLRIAGNRFIASTTSASVAAIYVQNAISVSITDNYIYNRQLGIWIINSRGSVADNILHSCSVAGILINDTGAASAFEPLCSNNQGINTPTVYASNTATGVAITKGTLAFGNRSAANKVIAANSTLAITLAQGSVTFSSDRFAYRCSLQLYRNGGAFNILQAEFYIGRGFIGGGGFRNDWGVTTPTWIIDPDNLRTLFSLSLNSATGILTLTSTDSSFSYSVGLTVDYVEIQSIA